MEERISKKSKDGQVSFTCRSEINGVKMDWSFLDKIIDDYDNGRPMINTKGETFDSFDKIFGEPEDNA